MSSRTALLIAGGFVVAVGTLAWLAISHSENQTSGIPSSNRGQHTPDSLHEMIEILRPLHKKMGEPEPGDWLAMHEEKGQTFAQYAESDPVVAEPGRRIIYVQPLGEFEKGESEIVSLTAEFLELYFELPVKRRRWKWTKGWSNCCWSTLWGRRTHFRRPLVSLCLRTTTTHSLERQCAKHCVQCWRKDNRALRFPLG